MMFGNFLAKNFETGFEIQTKYQKLQVFLRYFFVSIIL